MNKVEFRVIKYKKGTFEPETIERASDGKWFSIGERVTNGTKMQGKIIKFSCGDIVNVPVTEQEVYVLTDWSGVGMNLSSLSHVKKEDKEGAKLPSTFQINQVVSFTTLPAFNLEQLKNPTTTCSNTPIVKLGATIRGVHFTESKVKYDLELCLVDNQFTRIYNVDSCFVEEV